MKFGKPHLHTLPSNDVTNLGAFADQVQQEALARGETLPPAAHLHIGEPSFRTPAHIVRAAIEALQSEPMTYGPPAGWPWLREVVAEKIERVNGYHVDPQQIAIAMGGTGALQSALLATVGVGDEVLLPDPHWPQYRMQLASCGATGVPYPLDPHNDWLPERDREVLTCRFLLDLSTRETAVRMGLTEGNVKAIQHRALKRAAALDAG